MAKKNIDEFFEVCRKNPDFLQKLKTLKPADKSGFIKLAHEAGLNLTAEEWNEFTNQFSAARQEMLSVEELSDDELGNVSAGGLFGIDLCQKRYDELLCDLGVFTCPHFHKTVLSKESKGSSTIITYERSCGHVGWKQTYTVNAVNDGLLH